MGRRVPRALIGIVQAGLFPVLFVGAPLSLAQIGQRYGWSARRPGAANLAGVLPLSAGTALLVWAVSSHYRAAPRGWEVSLTPGYLLSSGPYRFSRNPMYVGEVAIWAGWAVLFGNLPVTTGLAALIALQNSAIRVEERMLHKRWGATYDDYRTQVPRWVKLSWSPSAANGRRRRQGGIWRWRLAVDVDIVALEADRVDVAGVTRPTGPGPRKMPS